ncbi:MAG: hypothetical protein EBY02_06905, partial [Burkholderiaceae bacterium]|nr:hypothetical protein [Burkholderiaceae bacterium]
NVAAISGDPTADLRLSTDPNRDFLIASLTRELQLDVPPPLRYFLWLKGVLGVFVLDLVLMVRIPTPIVMPCNYPTSTTTSRLS